jgi:hypothetical protein
MGKPGAYPRWATLGTNNTPPLSGQQDTGWEPNQLAVSTYFNFLQNLNYQWLQFLDRREIATGMIQRLASFETGIDPEFIGQMDLRADDVIYALAPFGAGSAFIRQGSANNKLQIAPGILAQFVGEELLACTFTGADEVTIANGDAANPRVDIVQLEIGVNSEGVPTKALSVKQGTPAASPTYPTPDDGKCVIAGVVVGANYVAAAGLKFGVDTAGAVAVVHDQRMPLSVTPHTVMPKTFSFGADWSLQGTDTYLQKANNNGGNGLFIPCPIGGGTGRLLDVGIGMLDKNAQDSRFHAISYADGGAGSVSPQARDLAHANINGSGSNQFSYRHSGMLAFQGSWPAHVRRWPDGAGRRERDGPADLDERPTLPERVAAARGIPDPLRDAVPALHRARHRRLWIAVGSGDVLDREVDQPHAGAAKRVIARRARVSYNPGNVEP